MSDACNLMIKPAPGERVETTLLLPDAQDAVICGRVFHQNGEAASDVLAVLYSPGGTPLDHAVTDETGRFCFASLPPDQLYTIHLHERHRCVRILEVCLP